MKGIVLAGGTGSRLAPVTHVLNKHLLPIYDKPMICYPIQALANAGISEILVVTGGNSAGEFFRLLKNGCDFGVKHLTYAYQERGGGIAEALGLAEAFAEGQQVCVILGDNIIEQNICSAADRFRRQRYGAKVLLKQTCDPQRFGIAEIADDHIVSIEEKPIDPKSRYAVTGIYFYDQTVFQKVRDIKPSQRGEMEITDVNNLYIAEGRLTYDFLEGWWLDAGTFDSLLEASNLVAQTGANKMMATIAI